MDCASLCYLVSIIAAIILLVMGFMDLIKKRQKNESSEEQVISRQIRGFAFIMLSQVVLILGAMLCFAFSGGAGSRIKGMKGKAYFDLL